MDPVITPVDHPVHYTVGLLCVHAHCLSRPSLPDHPHRMTRRPVTRMPRVITLPPNVTCRRVTHPSADRAWRCLKLVRTLLNCRVLGTSTATVFSFKWSFSLCTYIPRMDIMLDFICTFQERVESDKMQDEKILAHSRTHNPEIYSLMLYRLSKPGLLNAAHLNDLNTYMLSRYPMYTLL